MIPVLTVFEGPPGAGKSYFAVDEVLTHLIEGGTVSTNLPLVWENIKSYVQDEYGLVLVDGQYHKLPEEIDKLVAFPDLIPHGTRECPILVVIDEAHMPFNSRDWATRSKPGSPGRKTMEFLSMARHYFVRCIFLSQQASKIDKQIVGLAQHVVYCRDLQFYALSPWLSYLLPLPPLFLRTFIDPTTGNAVKQKFARKNPKLFALYNSYVDTVGVERRNEVKRYQLEKVKKKSKMKYLIPVVFIAVVGWFAWSAFQRFFPKKDKAKTEVVTKSEESKVEKPILEIGPQVQSQGAYSIVRERLKWVLSDGRMAVGTESGHYVVGEMSVRGLVEKARVVTGGVVLLVRPPDGSLLYVLAESFGSSVAPVLPSALPAEAVKQEIIIADSMPKPVEWKSKSRFLESSGVER